ncbi:hypothetical protein ACERII_13695 [Evansella sp. AB-rgal1]|uniref:hypothetical protein n=1 Tax=Evansella sp. AB-rgal1 TaxID=3242696 RepID=UPI00359E4CD9
MIKTRIFSLIIFIFALIIALYSMPIRTDITIFYKALFIYLLFSCLYQHLRVVNKSGSASIDYGISYSLSFGMMAGPFGVFIFETIYRIIVFAHKKWTKTADPDELYHTF